ncbi:MAG: hypothetical protein LBN35_03860 [Clostridiales Family XIII bacterium]|jgi:type II secretory pathway pseudopilin PulG|nr:hypothetical protein [Clostridiales Family XIII bacterium]
MADKFQLNDPAVKSGPAEKKSNPVASAFRNLSKREQIMIYALVVIGVIAALVFLVAIPAMDNLTALQDETADLKNQEMEYRQVIAQADSYHEMFDEAQTTYKKAQKKYFKPMKPETLDEKITGYLMDAGFDPSTLSMSTLNVEGVPGYTAPILNPTAVPELPDTDTATADIAVTDGGAEDNADAAAAGGAGAEGADTGTEVADTTAAEGYDEAAANMGGAPAFVYTVNVSAQGEWSNLYKLLDTVRKKSGIEIISYQYNDASGGQTASKDTVTMVIKVYVFVKGVPASTGNVDAAVQ